MRRTFQKEIIALACAAWVVGAVGGCATRPPEKVVDLGVDVPETWSASGGTAGRELPPPGGPGAPWWTAFDDPALDAFVREALEQNRDLAAALARLEAAQARARIAGAPLWPEVGAATTGARRRQNFIGFPFPEGDPTGDPGSDERVLSSTTTAWGVSLDVSWEVDLWGRLRAGRSAADAEYAAAEIDLAGAALSLAGQTAKAYFTAAEATAQAALARETLESRQRTEELVRRRYEVGLRSSLDLRLALSNRALAEATLEQRRAAADLGVRQLEVLVNRYPAAELDPATAPPPLAPIPAFLPSELVARRPDLAAAEQRLSAAGYRVNEARAALYPRLALTGSAGRSSEELEDLLDHDFTVWSLVGNLLQPVFQGGRLRAHVDLAEAGFEEATARYASQVLGAFAEVETALAADSFLAAQVAALETAARQSREAEELALDRYRLGLADFLSVLEAQRQAAEAESGLLAARRQRLVRRVDLHLALGGGFEKTSIDLPWTPPDETP